MRNASLAVLGGALVLLAGCGSSGYGSEKAASAAGGASYRGSGSSYHATGSASTASAPGAPAAGSTLSVSAGPGPELRFDKTSLSSVAGKVTVAFTNSSPIDHNLTVASSTGAVTGETPTFHGGTQTILLSLTPGTYKFFCSVPGHRGAGMEGTLSVK